MPSPRIVFMGTPDFAVPSLALLLANHYEVVAVVTAPDKPQGRGRYILASPVKRMALAHGLPVLQPTQLSSPTFLATLQAYQADLQVVVAFRVLPKSVWAMPRLGTINLHASLLPQYRGAAPIHWAIINGERETGVTTFFIAQAIDTGHLLFQECTPIFLQDTFGTLHERLQHQGAQLLLKTVRAIASNNYSATPQATLPKDVYKRAPKLYKSDGEINWIQPSLAILNFIRGLSPYPAAWTYWRGKRYKILLATPAPFDKPHLAPGALYVDESYGLCVGTQDTPIAIKQLQPEGKRIMDTSAFLRGYTI